jgi:hypothetical protein
MLKVFTFFIAVFSTIVHANSKDFSYVYKTGVAPGQDRERFLTK